MTTHQLPKDPSTQQAGPTAALPPFSDILNDARRKLALQNLTEVEQFAIQMPDWRGGIRQSGMVWLGADGSWFSSPAKAAVFNDWDTATAICRLLPHACRVETRQTFRLPMPGS